MTDQPVPLDEAVIAQARAELGAFFSSTIEALGADVRKLLSANGAPPDQKVVNQLTSEMIKLLAERVKSAIPNAPLP